MFLVVNSMIVVSHPSDLEDFAPCDFFMFLNMKLKLKRWYSNLLSRFRNNHNRFLNTFEEKYFREHLKHSRRGGIIVLMHKDSTAEGMETSFKLAKFANFSNWIVVAKVKSGKEN